MELFGRFLVILFAALVVASDDGDGSSSSSKSKHKRPNKPNIVHFFVDNWGFEIGYEDEFYHTPFMDEMAASGIKLSYWYTARDCTPSRTRLMTGKHEVRCGMGEIILPDTPYGLPLNLKLLPQHLKDLDYSTYMVGKWHLGHHRIGYTPTRRGFDKFYGYYNGVKTFSTHQLYCPVVDFANGDIGYDLRDMEDVVPIREVDGIYDAFIFSRESDKMIYRHNPKKPMYFYMSSHDTHAYIGNEAPQKYIDMYANKVENMSESTANYMSRRGAKATVVDDMIKNMVTTLKETGLWNNTIFIVTSDNGIYDRPMPPNEQGVPDFMLPNVREGRFRGPAFIYSPLFPKESQGRVIDNILTIYDLFPTIINLAGGNLDPKTTDGKDLWDLLINDVPPEKNEVLHYLGPDPELVGDHMFPDSFDSRKLASIGVDDYKLITGCMDMWSTHWDNGTFLLRGCHKFWAEHGRNYYLYNIKEDPNEENDLADDPDHFDRIMHMMDRLKYWDTQAVPALSLYPQAQPTSAGCPSNIPANADREYKFFGPYATGEDWQLSIPN